MNRQIGIVGLPDELTVGAVVLDRDGMAWQHCRAAGQASSAWVRVGAALFGGTLPWTRLVVDRGPLTPLVPEPEPTDGAQVTPVTCARHTLPGANGPVAAPVFGCPDCSESLPRWMQNVDSGAES